MSLFQKSVEKKYFSELDFSLLDTKYSLFNDYFGNPEIQENIRNSKEEQFQEGFLRELFVKILDYTLNPDPQFNLTTEFKNVDDSKKADGAILSGEDAIAIIELKSTDITDLDKVEAQAFGYKHHQPKCIYVITSNFEKLRFYIENAVDYIEFDLFNLTRDQFGLLWLCLSKDSVLNNLPLTLKKSSVLQEENITKKLYADYSKFREQIFGNIVKNNPDFDELLLFNKTQKLLDRFLFIFFAEDRLLLPPNSISEIVKQWTTLKDELDEYIPLYGRFKKYFGYMNTGYKGKKYDIFPYNGGLFLPDEILDNIKIDDDILYEHTLKLSAYDFETDVDVNILGHIFEHSLSEIENVQARLRGEQVDKVKSKRKKDGIFYTPKYITKYIVENTVGRLCKDKRQELGIIDEEYSKGRKNRKKETVKALDNKLLDYRAWLLSLTILDPACGSGAFLNQALGFLIKEHGKIDELRAQLLGGGIVFSDISTDILERNIYGVDLNEESVEIAKLSLWLRTAQKGRKLNTLSNNIKCGNSLINDPSIDEQKAFEWQKEFPEIFSEGGFDVVIGNPPYLRVQGLRENFVIESEYYENSFKSATGRFDIYVLFIEKSLSLINKKGVVSFILPHKFLVSDFGSGIRKYLLENNALESILHFGSNIVFEDASTYTCIIKLSNGNTSLMYQQIHPREINNSYDLTKIEYKGLTGEKWSLSNREIGTLITKLKIQPWTIKDVFSAIRTGVDTGTDDLFILEGKLKGDLFHGFSKRLEKAIVLESAILKPLLKGKDVKRYEEVLNDHYVIYPHKISDNKTVPIEEDSLKRDYPKTYSYLFEFKDELTKKKIHKKTNPQYWYSLHRSRDLGIFEQMKIVTPETSLGGNMSIDSDNYYHNTQVYSLIKRDEIAQDYRFWLAILNSKLLWCYLKSTGAVLRGGYFRFKTKHLEPFPLPNNADSQHQAEIIEKVDKLFEDRGKLNIVKHSFSKYLQSQFQDEPLGKKLINWHKLEFDDFITDLNNRAKKTISRKLTKSDEIEWLEIFDKKKAEVQLLEEEINITETEINQTVYELYGLSEEEIRIVEDN